MATRPAALRRAAVAAVLTLATLAGCGGGSGGDDPRLPTALGGSDSGAAADAPTPGESESSGSEAGGSEPGAGKDGAGEGGTVTPAAYATAFCAAVGDFQDAVDNEIDQLSEALPADLAPVKSRRVLLDYVDGLAKEARVTASDLRAAGTPDLDDGAGLADSVVEAYSGVAQTLRGIRGDVKDLPTTDRDAFVAGAADIGKRIKKQIGSAFEGLDAVRSQELAAAVDQSETCRDRTRPDGGRRVGP